MSRLTRNFQQASRGSSRGISYYNMKSSTPSYGASSGKNTKYYDQKLLKSSTPAHSSIVKSSLKEKNTNIYESNF